MPTPADAAGMVAKLYSADELNGTPGERSVVAWISTDIVDREGDVVVAEGVDFRSEFLDTNPVLLAVHDMKQWPIGTFDTARGGWVKVKRGKGFTGLMAKMFFDTDTTSEEIFGKYRRGVCRSFSIRFRPPSDMKSGEWGPPTAAELKEHPHWAGAKSVIRRCVVVETSACPVGMNQESLALSVSKAVPVAPEIKAMIESNAPADETPAEMSTVVDIPEPVVEPDPTPEPPETVAKAAESKPDAPADEPIKSGHYVEYGKGRSGGCGQVKSIHKAGKVPGVPEDVEGSEGEPAAKVKCYAKASGADGAERWKQTEKCMGAKCKDLSRIPHEMEKDMDGDDDGGDVEESAKALAPVVLAPLPKLPPGRPWQEIEEERAVKVIGSELDRLFGVV